MSFLIHTDFGHDPDDAIALAYLIEHGYTPSMIGLTPGHLQQNEALSGFLNSYKLWGEDIVLYYAKQVPFNPQFSTGHHKVFNDDTLLPAEEFEIVYVEKALVIGPAINLGPKLGCEELYFQGGYSPNSVAPLAKFEGVQAIESFNPNGSKKDFDLLLTTPTIGSRYYIGKNVCHGFTKHHLKKMWEPKNPLVRKFWNQLAEYKAMHDVVAAMIFVNKDLGIWEQAKPTRIGNKFTTTPTTEEIYTLIGLKL